MTAKIIRFLPACLWMIFIFFLSSQSTTGIGQTKTERFLILKSLHLVEYAALYFFFYFASNQRKKSAIFTYLYALSDELHQSFIPGRQGKFIDTLIDFLGIVIGIILTSQLIKITFLKKIILFKSNSKNF